MESSRCCHWWKKRTWKSFFLGDHMFRLHDAFGAKILFFLAMSVVRIEAVESGKITKPAMVCWHICMLFLLLRFNLSCGRPSWR